MSVPRLATPADRAEYKVWRRGGECYAECCIDRVKVVVFDGGALSWRDDNGLSPLKTISATYRDDILQPVPYLHNLGPILQDDTAHPQRAGVTADDLHNIGVERME